MNFYFENIRLINPAANFDSVINLWVKDGNIVHCKNDKPNIDNDTEKIDGKNLICSPGFFDMHVHFREPGYEYKEDIASGCESAANGGFTGVVTMPNTSPAVDNAQTVEFIKAKAVNKLVDVIPSASITQNRAGTHISDMLELDELGVVLFTDDGNCVVDSQVMRRAFDYASTKDLLLSQHCEDHALTKDFSMNESIVSYKLGLKGYPAVAEEIIVSRDIRLAEFCGNRRYHVSHISTKGAIEIVRAAKKRGVRVSCEVTPHHFSLSDELLVSYDTNLKMNPPLREERDIEAIIEAIKDGTIDCIASDHAPHSLNEKEVEYEIAPHGILGLETSVGLTFTKLYHAGHVSLPGIINLMSVNPRKILGLPEIQIKEGISANLTLIDPDEEWIVEMNLFKSKSRNTPFNGEKLKGKPKFVFNNGKFIKSNL